MNKSTEYWKLLAFTLMIWSLILSWQIHRQQSQIKKLKRSITQTTDSTKTKQAMIQ